MIMIAKLIINIAVTILTVLDTIWMLPNLNREITMSIIGLILLWLLTLKLWINLFASKLAEK